MGIASRLFSRLVAEEVAVTAAAKERIVKPMLSLKRDPVRYRAVLVIASLQGGGDYWLVQELRTFWRFKWWHDLRSLAAEDDAQDLVDRLQYNGLILPSRES